MKALPEIKKLYPNQRVLNENNWDTKIIPIWNSYISLIPHFPGCFGKSSLRKSHAVHSQLNSGPKCSRPTFPNRKNQCRTDSSVNHCSRMHELYCHMDLTYYAPNSTSAREDRIGSTLLRTVVCGQFRPR